MTPTVTVLITVFNCEDFILPAIESALAQNHENFEILVIDDGATDRTNELVRSVCDRRIRILEPGRLGRARALNFGIQNALGDLIAILDADDLCLPGRLSTQSASLVDNDQIAIVGSRYRPFIDGSGSTTGREDVEPMAFEDIVFKFKSGATPLFHSSVMFRKSMILTVGGYDESLACLLDFDLYVRVAARFEIRNLDARLAFKRVHRKQYFAGEGGVHFRPEADHARSVIQSRVALLPVVEAG